MDPLIALMVLLAADPAQFPLDHHAIRYSDPATHNPIARLGQRLDQGGVRLAYHPDFGYLPALLDALRVPVSSQVLVFSQTSFQAARIAPRTPRALYHTPDITIGYVRGGDVLEIMTYDDERGTVFYTLDQERVRHPRFDRRGAECLQCHQTEATLNVPGFFVRSIVPDRGGRVVFPGPSHLSDHRSPLADRWGGWYVSGTHGSAKHMGNNWVERGEASTAFDAAKGANITDLSRFFTPEAYLSPHSDLVSLLVMEHQALVMNLISRVAFQVKLGRQPELDELAAALRLEGEAVLEAPVKGTSTFAADYQKAGPDRQLDLKTRLFVEQRSPMLHSAAYRALPAELRAEIEKKVNKPSGTSRASAP